MDDKNMPNYYWDKVVVIAIYIMNKTPTAAMHGVTFEEKFIGSKLDIAHLNVLDALHMCTL